MEVFFETMRANLLPHWPFAMMAIVFMVVGQVMTTRVFTRERAYDTYDSSIAGWIWYWGRETLPLHPILAGALLGIVWQDPEAAGLGLVPSMGYFAGSGAVSLFTWIFLKAYYKRRLGVDIYLPGESMKPSSDEDTPARGTKKP